jgi:hypothetical protein
MDNLRLGDLSLWWILFIALSFVIVGIILAYFLWAVFVILLLIGAFVVLHEFLHFVRGD